MCVVGIVWPAFGQSTARTADRSPVSDLTGEVSRIKERSRDNSATSESIDSTDQRLMDAERALLQSLSARSVSNTVATSPNVPAKAKIDEEPKAQIKPDSIKTPAVEKPTKSTESAEPVAAVVSAAATTRDTVISPEVTNLKSANVGLKRDLESARARIDSLERELSRVRSQLALSETEITRLSARLDAKARASLGKYNLNLVSSAPAPRQPIAQRPAPMPQQSAPITEIHPPTDRAELHVATVIVDKADLRLGPGKNHSALMAVPRGSRLVVEAREGDWYRVFAPNGERAWVFARAVVFGDGAATLNDGSSVQVKGFNAGVEDEAFRKVQKIVAGQ